MKTRAPYVAGRFYEEKKEVLELQITNALHKEEEQIDLSLAEKNILGGIVPHAGYMFSAYQAVHYFRILAKKSDQPEVFFIINPNHSGLGPSIALDENRAWETPLGKVGINMEFYDLLSFPYDANAHAYEHSGEVMLPFLQYFLQNDFTIVPITLSKQTPESAELLANTIFEANKQLKKKINIIASSDFSHFVSPEQGKKQDDYAVKQILDMEPTLLYNEIQAHQISACGYGPIMTLMYYAKLIAQEAQMKMLKRGHSGEIMPSNEVVHYISFLCHA